MRSTTTTLHSAGCVIATLRPHEAEQKPGFAICRCSARSPAGMPFLIGAELEWDTRCAIQVPRGGVDAPHARKVGGIGQRRRWAITPSIVARR